MLDRRNVEECIRARLKERLLIRRGELLLSEDEIEAVADGFEYLNSPKSAFKLTSAIGGDTYQNVYSEAAAATGDVIHPLLIQARAERFEKANGKCECPGVGCDVPTHVIIPDKGQGIAFSIMRCDALVAPNGPEADSTRVILMHDYDDPIDPANLRVFCVRCADCYERAMQMSPPGN